MKVLKKIDVISFAKFEAVLMTLVGFVLGLFYALGITTAGSLMTRGKSGIGAGLGLLAIALIPIFYAVMGFVVGLIMGYLTNLALKLVKGVKIELVDEITESPVTIS